MKFITDEEFSEFIGKVEASKVVFVKTPTCSKCRTFLNQHESELSDNVLVYEFGAKTSDSVRDVLVKLEVYSVPAIIWIEKPEDAISDLKAKSFDVPEFPALLEKLSEYQ
jgi:hypothetical protein